jgi:putative PIN family toxin of toxin-antitoxin system
VSADYAKVVVDTNMLLSAALVPHSVPAELVDRLLAESRLVFSPGTFAELASRIWKPKFDRYLPMERRRHILHELDACALWVEAPAAISGKTWSRDAKDDPFIHAALAAGATRLISGDDDLLCLHPIGDLYIVTPRAALDELGKLTQGAQ